MPEILDIVSRLIKIAPRATVADMGILLVIEDGAIYSRDVRDQLPLSAVAVSRRLEKLERDGLIKCSRTDNDGRRMRLSLSRSAREAITEVSRGASVSWSSPEVRNHG